MWPVQHRYTDCQLDKRDVNSSASLKRAYLPITYVHSYFVDNHGMVLKKLISAMALDRRKLGVFVAAFALRVLFFCAFPSLPDLLTGRVEISTPVSSFKRCECYTRLI